MRFLYNLPNSEVNLRLGPAGSGSKVAQLKQPLAVQVYVSTLSAWILLSRSCYCLDTYNREACCQPVQSSVSGGALRENFAKSKLFNINSLTNKSSTGVAFTSRELHILAIAQVAWCKTFV